MFFSDPGAAFANLAAALRPEARLVLLVWQRRPGNGLGAGDRRRAGRRERSHRRRAWTRSRSATPTPPRACLEGAGLRRTCASRTFTNRCFYGHDLDAALALVRGFQDTSAALASLSDGEAARTVERLRETLAAHYTDEHGVVARFALMVDHRTARARR